MDRRDVEIDYLRRTLQESRYQIAILVKMLAQAINELRTARSAHDGSGKPWQQKP